MRGTRPDKKKLNIGCGLYHVKGFINIDYHLTKEMVEKQIKMGNKVAKIEKGSEYLKADVMDLPFEDDSIDYIETIDMIEHLPFRSVGRALSEMRRVLKPKCKLRMLTVNFDTLAQEWVDDIKGKQFDPKRYIDLMESIYGNQLHSGEFHKIAFNPIFLSAMFDATKWSKYKITSYPRFSAVPKFEATPFPKGSVMRTEALLVEAIK